ncbi:MAG: hypothetical protein NTW74_21170 [Acidobacteria bacterium]|nr:hypothetical protein [Acidobacteriota bacterium]
MKRRQFLVLPIPALLAGASPIVGRWRSVTTTKGGIGAVYDFRANGSVAYSSTALVESEFSVDGQVLTLGGQRVGIGWHPDGRLQFNFGQNVVEDYSRKGEVVDAANPLLGEWAGSRDMAGRKIPVSMQFRAGNRALMVLFLKTVVGRYQGGAGPWTMTLPSLPARQAVAGADGTLTITASGGDPHPFSRL